MILFTAIINSSVRLCSVLCSYSFVNTYTANVGRMTKSNNVISTNAYEPK